MLGRICHIFGATIFAAAALFPADVTLGQAGISPAPGVDDKTRCSAVGTGTAAMGRDKFIAIDTYIRDVMLSADASYGRRRRAEIMPKLSRDGMENAMAMVFVMCRDNPNRTIRAQALEIYEGMRGLQRSLGAKGL